MFDTQLENICIEKVHSNYIIIVCKIQYNNTQKNPHIILIDTNETLDYIFIHRLIIF